MKKTMPPIQFHKIAGIYEIRNIVNGKVYIGSTVDLYHRARKHLTPLKRGDHPSILLRNAAKKYGIENFRFGILKTVDPIVGESRSEFIDRLRLIEQGFITDRKSNTKPYGYNIRIEAHTNWGKPLHPETKKKMATSLFSKPAELRGGENAHNAKLTTSQVKEIKVLLYRGMPSRQIAKQFNITTSPIEFIKNGKSWKFVNPTDDQLKNYKKGDCAVFRYTAKQKEDAKKLLLDGMRNCNVARELGIKITTIKAIRRSLRESGLIDVV